MQAQRDVVDYAAAFLDPCPPNRNLLLRDRTVLLPHLQDEEKRSCDAFALLNRSQPNDMSRKRAAGHGDHPRLDLTIEFGGKDPRMKSSCGGRLTDIANRGSLIKQSDRCAHFANLIRRHDVPRFFAGQRSIRVALLKPSCEQLNDATRRRILGMATKKSCGYALAWSDLQNVPLKHRKRIGVY